MSTAESAGESLSLRINGASSQSVSSSASLFSVEACLKLAYEGKLVDTASLVHICNAARLLFVEELNVINVASPATVVGDIHGQFTDLLTLLKKTGHPPDVTLVFLGDYVDRGPKSVETIVLLFLLKLQHPNRVVLLRGYVHFSPPYFSYPNNCWMK